MTIITAGATRAAAIGFASRRVEIAKSERDRHLRWVNEKTAELADLQDKLDKSEVELRVEEFTLNSLIGEATANGNNIQYLHPTKGR